MKVVPYFFLGQFSTENLLTSAVLLPISIPATFLGVWLIRRIDAKRFYEVIYILIFAIGAFLMAESLSRCFDPRWLEQAARVVPPMWKYCATAD